jgi:hypothetical protein
VAQIALRVVHERIELLGEEGLVFCRRMGLRECGRGGGNKEGHKPQPVS